MYNKDAKVAEAWEITLKERKVQRFELARITNGYWRYQYCWTMFVVISERCIGCIAWSLVKTLQDAVDPLRGVKQVYPQMR